MTSAPQQGRIEIRRGEPNRAVAEKQVGADFLHSGLGFDEPPLAFDFLQVDVGVGRALDRGVDLDLAYCALICQAAIPRCYFLQVL